jgi:WD40 repeat protein
LWAKAALEPEHLTPQDFRLRADSAGYRAGPDGKDLGADVDLVGPGAAYERWKQTPEYQQWLADTGQLKETVAKPQPLQMVRRFAENSASWITAIQFAPDSDRTVVTSFPQGIDVWDSETGAHSTRVLLPGEPRSLGFVADKTRLVGVTYQGKLLSLEWPSGEVMLEKPAHKPVATASVMLSQSRLASTGHDGLVRIWDARTGEQLQELPAAPGQNYCLPVAPDERHLVAGGAFRVSVWDLTDGKFVRNLGTHPFNVYAVAISPDNRYVLTGGQTGLVQLFELDAGKLVRSFDKHTGLVGSLAFLPDGRQFVSGAMDGTLRVWSIDGQEVARHESLKNDVSRLAVTSDGRHVLTAGTGIGIDSIGLPKDATLQLWELPPSVWPVAAEAKAEK